MRSLVTALALAGIIAFAGAGGMLVLGYDHCFWIRLIVDKLSLPRGDDLWLRLAGGWLVAMAAVLVAPLWRQGRGGVGILTLAMSLGVALGTGFVDDLTVELGAVGLVIAAVVSAAANEKLEARTVALVVLTGLAPPIGGFLAAGSGEDDRGVRSYRGYLVAIQDDLGALKGRLADYAARSGHYPDNEEGLAGLPWSSTFRFHFYRARHGAMPGLVGRSGGCCPLPPSYVSEIIRRAGWLPASEDEFLQSLRMPSHLSDEKVEPLPIQLVLDRAGWYFALGEAGPYDRWWLPYVYENRRGLPASSFVASPASGDRARRYSVQVAPDVYISSVGGQLYAEKLDQAWWARTWPRIVGGGMIVAAFCLAIWLLRRRSWKSMATAIVVALCGAGAGAGVGSLSMTTCYMMGPSFSHREPEMVVRQKALLERYRRAGVLSAGAYERAIRAIEYPTAPLGAKDANAGARPTK